MHWFMERKCTGFIEEDSFMENDDAGLGHRGKLKPKGTPTVFTVTYPSHDDEIRAPLGVTARLTMASS